MADGTNNPRSCNTSTTIAFARGNRLIRTGGGSRTVMMVIGALTGADDRDVHVLVDILLRRQICVSHLNRILARDLQTRECDGNPVGRAAQVNFSGGCGSVAREQAARSKSCRWCGAALARSSAPPS